MHSLQSAAVQYINYGTGSAFELPTQSGTLICIALIIGLLHLQHVLCTFQNHLSHNG